MLPNIEPNQQTKQSNFAEDVLKLVSGTTIAQMLGIFVAPILTRLYAPEAFGIAALFGSITSIIGVISCMRYELSIMLPKTDGEAANLLGVSLGFATVISILTVPIVWLGQPFLADWLNAPSLQPYLWLVPPTIFIIGTALALSYWDSRTKRFDRLSIARIIAASAKSGGKLGAGLAGYAAEGSLIGANILGSATSVLVLGSQIWRDDRHIIRQNITRHGMIKGVKRYYKFPVFSVWTTLLNTLSWQLPTLMLSVFFSPTVVGFYSLGNRLVRMPMILIGKSLAQVFYQRASVAHNENNLNAIVRQVYARLVAYGLFPMLLMTIVGEELFVALLGDQWAEAGVYSQILSIYLFFNFISRPLGQLFSILEKQEVNLVVNVFLLLSRIGALWIGGHTDDILFTLALFSISGVLVYGGYSMWITHAVGISFKDWSITLLRSAIVSGIFLAPGWLLSKLFNVQSWGILIAYSLCAVAYYLWLISNDRQMRNLIHNLHFKLLKRGTSE